MSGVDYQQFVGKPFQVISNLGIRYTGIFDHIDQQAQTVCLGHVWNWGTEERPVAKKFPPNKKNLGWVRFKTDGIESLSVIENYIEPNYESETPFADPTLLSVSEHRPSGVPQPQYANVPALPPHQIYSQAPPQLPYQQATPQQNTQHNLPQRPATQERQSSASKAMDRVQQSLSNLATQPRGAGPVQVPTTEFDFSQTRQFQSQREASRKQGVEGQSDDEDEAELSHVPSGPSQPRAPAAYKKSDNFFDDLSHQTGKVGRNEEIGRNLDTFGEAGGDVTEGHVPSNRGGRGGYGMGPGYGGRGGYGGRSGFGQGQGQQPRGGRGGRGGYGGRGRGGENGFRGGRSNSQGLAPTRAAFD